MVAVVVRASTNKCGIEVGTASFFHNETANYNDNYGCPWKFGDWLPSYVCKSLVATLIKIEDTAPRC